MKSRGAFPGRLLASVALALLAAMPMARAHEARPAYLELRETGPGQYSLLWRTPVLAGQRLPVVLSLPAGVRNLRPPDVQELADSRVERRWIDAGPGGLAGKRIEFLGLQFTITDVFARVELRDGRNWTTIARPGQAWVEVTADMSAWEVAGNYILEGIRHILFGVDHLLFVLALLILVKGARRLIATVTAFTVAHSLTLAGATLGFVHVPGPPVEACIALSIVFVAAEIVHSGQGKRGLTENYPWVVAFTFGLLHGFGFASALNEVGLPQSSIPVALLCFNIGVEIGQLSFIASVLAVIAIVRQVVLRMRVPQPGWAWRVPPYVIGGVAAFWMIQRVAAL